MELDGVLASRPSFPAVHRMLDPTHGAAGGESSMWRGHIWAAGGEPWLRVIFRLLKYYRARALNPNLASAWYSSGWVRIYLGDPAMAVAHFAHAMRLSPLDQRMFLMQTGTASAHFHAGRSDEASIWADRALREKPNWPMTIRIAAASNARAGRLERAQKLMARVRELDPAFRVSNTKDLPFTRTEDLARFQEGLRTAGLPE